MKEEAGLHYSSLGLASALVIIPACWPLSFDLTVLAVELSWRKGIGDNLYFCDSAACPGAS